MADSGSAGRIPVRSSATPSLSLATASVNGAESSDKSEKIPSFSSTMTSSTMTSSTRTSASIALSEAARLDRSTISAGSGGSGMFPAAGSRPSSGMSTPSSAGKGSDVSSKTDSA